MNAATRETDAALKAAGEAPPGPTKAEQISAAFREIGEQLIDIIVPFPRPAYGVEAMPAHRLGPAARLDYLFSPLRGWHLWNGGDPGGCAALQARLFTSALRANIGRMIFRYRSRASIRVLVPSDAACRFAWLFDRYAAAVMDTLKQVGSVAAPSRLRYI